MFNHPKNVCMTYWQHFKFSMYISYLLARGSVSAVGHAIYPDKLTKCGIKDRYVPDMNNSDLYKIKVDKSKQVEMTNKLLFQNQEFCNTYVPPMAKNQTPFHNYSRIELNPFKNPLNK